MHIFVELPSSEQQIEIDIEGSENVIDLKDLLLNNDDVNLSADALSMSAIVYEGQELEDEGKPLNEFGIEDGDTVILRL